MALSEVGVVEKRKVYELEAQTKIGYTDMYTCPPGVIATVELVHYESDNNGTGYGLFGVRYERGDNPGQYYPKNFGEMTSYYGPGMGANGGLASTVRQPVETIGKNSWLDRSSNFWPKFIKIYEGQSIYAYEGETNFRNKWVIAVTEEPIDVEG